MWIHLLIGLQAAAFGASEPITLFDLTPALRFNAKEPAQVSEAWDTVHAVSTLQGIVNRDGPQLYVRFVEFGGLNVDDFWLQRLSEPGQWLAGRSKPRITILTQLVERFRPAIKGVVLYDPAVPATSNLASTIAGVEDLIAVRYDPAPQSVYTQLVVRGPRLPVVKRLLNEDGTSMFTGTGTIPGTGRTSTGSPKCDAYLWLKHHYLDTGKTDPRFLAYYIDAWWMNNPTPSSPNQHTLTNHDFFVSKKAFFFDLSCWGDEAPVDDPKQKLGTDLATLKEILLSAYERGGREHMTLIGGFTPWAFKYTDFQGAGGKHQGVPTEWEFSRIISAYNGFIDADAIGLAAMANASFYAHFPLQEEYPQPWVTPEQLRERNLLDDEGRGRFQDRQFIIFYVGDFDSSAWVYQWMPTNWRSPARGKIPLMWCISPALEYRAGPMLDYLRRTASRNDYFAAADNGAGYLNPGMLQEPRPVSGLPSGLDAWRKHCTRLYGRWDLTISGFVIDGFAPGLNKDGLDTYAAFSPNGLVAQKIPPSLLHGNMPVMRADYDLPDNPDQAVGVLLERVKARKLPFHWFRAILKNAEWYEHVYTKARAADRRIELLDAPTFFELYRQYLKTTPEAAAGKIPVQ